MPPCQERFRLLAEHWFLREPAFFSMYCTHQLTSNPRMSIPIRVGKGRIEYMPEIIQTLSDAEFEETVGVEMLRLFLKHPYERKPAHCPGIRMIAASDMALWSAYKFSYIHLIAPDTCNLPSGKHYEWYLEHLSMKTSPFSKEEQESRLGQNAEERPEDTAEECRKTAGQNGASAASPHAPERIPRSYRNADEQTALWEEDEEMQEHISEIIQSVKDWGSLSGKMAETILAADRVRIDYRQILNSFKASILSSRRCLTRMKPSRRYGYQQMGQRHSFSTGLLIAIDTSGSISSTALCKFYGIVNHFFQYGIEHMDVIQFDAAVQGEPVSLRKARKEIKACGRGGTNFQPVIDFAAQRQNRYDGLLILTDGHAPIPILPQGFHLRIAWVCESREAFLKHKGWMQSLGKACYMNL